MQMETIKPSLQANVISSFWMMLKECESNADCDDDVLLKHMVEGWYRQWNEMTGDDKQPVWKTRVKQNG
jgi:hypothetical protein